MLIDPTAGVYVIFKFGLLSFGKEFALLLPNVERVVRGSYVDRYFVGSLMVARFTNPNLQ